jgi:hypothetical protein
MPIEVFRDQKISSTTERRAYDPYAPPYGLYGPFPEDNAKKTST